MLSLLHANHEAKNNLDLTSLPCSCLVQREGNLALGHLQVIWSWRSASLPPLESFSIDCSGWPCCTVMFTCSRHLSGDQHLGLMTSSEN